MGLKERLDVNLLQNNNPCYYCSLLTKEVFFFASALDEVDDNVVIDQWIQLIRDDPDLKDLSPQTMFRYRKQDYLNTHLKTAS